MPAYEICYLNDDRSLACAVSAICKDDLHAKIFAHAMKLSEYRCFEVWQGETIVYERPGAMGHAVGTPTKNAASLFMPRQTSPAQHPFA